MPMRRITLILFFLSVLSRTGEYSPVSFLYVFDSIFLNSGKTFIYNYGLNTMFMAGDLVPIAVPLSLYGVWRYREDSKLQTVGVAVAQASIISTILTTGIKAFIWLCRLCGVWRFNNHTLVFRRLCRRIVRLCRR